MVPSLTFQPHSSGFRELLPFHCCTCKYTLRLWYLAAADVGGRVLSWAGAIFSTNLHSRSPSSVSAKWPPYMQTRQFSPALVVFLGRMAHRGVSLLQEAVFPEIGHTYWFSDAKHSWCCVRTEQRVDKQYMLTHCFTKHWLGSCCPERLMISETVS